MLHKQIRYYTFSHIRPLLVMLIHNCMIFLRPNSPTMFQVEDSQFVIAVVLAEWDQDLVVPESAGSPEHFVYHRQLDLEIPPQIERCRQFTKLSTIGIYKPRGTLYPCMFMRYFQEAVTVT